VVNQCFGTTIIESMGFLYQGAADSPVMNSRIQAFREGLRDFGYFEGQNIRVLYRNTVQSRELVTLAKELVEANVDLIAAMGSEASLAAQRVTSPQNS
jgi:hypothetical protein